MGLRDLLSPLREHQQARSRARGEADAIEHPSEAGLAVPHPAESDTDFGTGPSALPTSVPPTSQNRGSNGTRTVLFRRPHLTAHPYNADNVVSDPTQSVTRKGKHPKLWDRILDRKASTSENELSWKLVKSVADSLAAALKHCDVRPVSLTLSMRLTSTLENDGQSTNNRIIDTSDQRAREISPYARSRERGQGA